MTTILIVGIVDNMKAELAYRYREISDDGAQIDIVVWKLPKPDAERPHGIKYRLYYGRDGQRLVGYDNERGKGDHKHLGVRESAYRFESLDKLLADFWVDVETIRSKS